MIETAVHEGILEVLIHNPPVNALGAAVRRALAERLASATADDSIRAIVIRGAGKLFSAGADIAEFGKPPASPWLPELVAQIENCPKPVVAAIHGSALGGGLEIALGCHYRIAAPAARLGLPEVKLGILPGAGGTQRLPRIIGALPALEMIVTGEPVSAERAAELGLVDRLATGEDALGEQAIALARSLAAPRRTGDRTVAGETSQLQAFAERNARLFALDAPKACLEAVTAAMRLPLAQGLARERELFETLVRSDQSKALRHVFFAERASARIEGLPSALTLRPVRRVGVIGAGTMGGGIAMNFLSIGVPVTLSETSREALERGCGVIRRNYEASAAKGRLSAEQVAAAMALLEPSLDFGALGACDLIIEAVYENLEVKQEVFAKIDAVAKAGAMLASNTSYLSIDEIALATRRPEDVLGLHFFSPAHIMKLLEVVRGARTAPEVLASAMDLARRIGKVPVVSGVCFGFIGNRMLRKRQEQATALAIEGAAPERIDRLHTEFGMPMGPFQMSDLAGLDIGWHRDPSRIDTIRDALCAQGRFGQKSGAGFYDYDDKRRPSPSPVTARIIEEFRARAASTPRDIGDEEIIVRTLYTMVNEGARILEEHIAQRASDIDVVWIHGYGWPRHTGGPLFWAQNRGFDVIEDGLQRYAARLGPEVRLSSLLGSWAAEARRGRGAEGNRGP